MLASNVTSVLSFCLAERFRSRLLELENIDTGNVEVLDIQSGGLSARPDVFPEHDKVHKALFIKDKCAI